ncbi:TPM domain-containing protein [Lysinibacillus macroides]|nr:TPM domain-containing protein [Lysinibacillus macroides]
MLLVLAMEDRKAPIKVSDGLQEAIADEQAGQILDDYTIPVLQEGKANQTRMNTFEVLLQTIKSEYILSDTSKAKNWDRTDWLGFLLLPSVSSFTLYYGLVDEGRKSKRDTTPATIQARRIIN